MTINLHNDDRGDDFADDQAAAAARGDILDDNQDDQAALDAQKAADDAKKAADDAEAARKAAESQSADELSEETDDEKAAREAEEAEADKKKRVRIPLSRHEEILTKARQREEALARRIKELEKKDAPVQKDVLGELKSTIDDLQDKYEELVFKGDKDEAKKVRLQLDEARERYTDTKVARSGALARAQTIDELKYEAALAKAEADYPALNPDNEADYDEAKADEVAELMTMFGANGLNRQAALEKAVKYVLGTPAQKKEAAKDDTAETLRVKREQEARRKAAEAAAKQPPDTSKAGTDNDKAGSVREQGIDVMKLSQDRFAKLDEDTLSRMRGDTL